MPFTSMVTGTVDGAGPEGPRETEQGVSGAGSDGASDREVAVVPVDERDDPERRIAALEAKVARLEADRDRLLAERRELHTRYEQVISEERRQPRRSSTPDDDGLFLRVARRLGLR